MLDVANGFKAPSGRASYPVRFIEAVVVTAKDVWVKREGYPHGAAPAAQKGELT